MLEHPVFPFVLCRPCNCVQMFISQFDIDSFVPNSKLKFSRKLPRFRWANAMGSGIVKNFAQSKQKQVDFIEFKRKITPNFVLFSLHVTWFILCGFSATDIVKLNSKYRCYAFQKDSIDSIDTTKIQTKL